MQWLEYRVSFRRDIGDGFERVREYVSVRGGPPRGHVRRLAWERLMRDGHATRATRKDWRITSVTRMACTTFR